MSVSRPAHGFSGTMGTNKSTLFPLDALLLVCVGVREALNLTGLAAEQTVQVGADLVPFTLLQVMALRASCLPLRSAAEVAFSLRKEVWCCPVHTLKRLAPFFASPVRVSISFNADSLMMITSPCEQDRRQLCPAATKMPNIAFHGKVFVERGMHSGSSRGEREETRSLCYGVLWCESCSGDSDIVIGSSRVLGTQVLRKQNRRRTTHHLRNSLLPWP